MIQRDELVFKYVKQRGVPIFMVTSGGYQKNNAQVIAASIQNLHSKRYISSDDLEGGEQDIHDTLEQQNTLEEQEEQMEQQDNLEQQDTSK